MPGLLLFKTVNKVSQFWRTATNMSGGIQVEARGDLLIVSEPLTDFVAIYVKPSARPQLMLMPPHTNKRPRSPRPSLAGSKQEGSRTGVDYLTQETRPYAEEASRVPWRADPVAECELAEVATGFY